MMKVFRVLLLVVAAALVVAACGSDETSVSSSDPPSSQPPATDPPASDPVELAIEVTVGGGFMPVGADFRTPPRYVVHDDGTVFTPAAVATVWPGPAVLPVIQGTISTDQVAGLLQAARDAGLVGDEPLEFEDLHIADAATTTITVVVDGVEHVTSVYALGAGGEALPGMPADGDDDRERVSAFVDAVSDAVTSADGDLWEPDRFAVLPLPPESVSQPEGMDADVRDWPLPETDVALRECLPVRGDDAEVLADALEDASEVTVWRTGDGTEFAAAVRPVLPHESDCPPAS